MNSNPAAFNRVSMGCDPERTITYIRWCQTPTPWPTHSLPQYSWSVKGIQIGAGGTQAYWGLLKHLGLPGNCCSRQWSSWESSAVGQWHTREGQKKLALGFPWHLPVCQSEHVVKGLKLSPETQSKGQTWPSHCISSRWGTGVAYLTRTCVLMWAPSYLGFMTP
jgi:hypothetical protein